MLHLGWPRSPYLAACAWRSICSRTNDCLCLAVSDARHILLESEVEKHTSSEAVRNLLTLGLYWRFLEAPHPFSTVGSRQDSCPCYSLTLFSDLATLPPSQVTKEAITAAENDGACPNHFAVIPTAEPWISNRDVRCTIAGIIFVDEIDKICTPSNYRHGSDASSEGVQRDMLPIIEGCTVSTKHGNVNTNHMLFIASGAFHSVKPSDRTSYRKQPAVRFWPKHDGG